MQLCQGNRDENVFFSLVCGNLFWKQESSSPTNITTTTSISDIITIIYLRNILNIKWLFSSWMCWNKISNKYLRTRPLMQCYSLQCQCNAVESGNSTVTEYNMNAVLSGIPLVWIKFFNFMIKINVWNFQSKIFFRAVLKASVFW